MGQHFKKYSKSKKLAELEIITKKNKIRLWVKNKLIEPYNWRK